MIIEKKFDSDSIEAKRILNPAGGDQTIESTKISNKSDGFAV